MHAYMTCTQQILQLFRLDLLDGSHVCIQGLISSKLSKHITYTLYTCIVIGRRGNKYKTISSFAFREIWRAPKKGMKLRILDMMLAFFALLLK